MGRRLVRALLAATLLLTLTACGTTEQIDFTGRTVDPPFTVDATELTSDEGEPVSLGPDDGAKQLRLVFFGYTHCPDICPAVLGSLASGLVKLSEEDRDRVQTYFVTSDPARDTADVLTEYVGRFDPSFRGLRGTIEDVAAVGRSMGIFVDEGEELASGGYDPNSHSTYVVAVGTDGKAPVFWNAETSPSQFAADIEFLLDGKVG